MKKIIICISTILLSVLYISCGKGERPEDTFSSNQIHVDFTRFDTEDRINLPADGKELFGSPVEIVTTQDYIAILDMVQSPWIAIFDKESMNLLGRIAPEGRGPGESINPGKLLPLSKDNTIWLFDGLMQRFQLFDIEAALAAKEADSFYEPERTFILIDSLRGSRDPSITHTGLFATTTYSHDDCRYFYFDENPQIVQKVGQLPPPQKDWPEQGGKAYFPIGATYYNAKLATHPKKDWVVVGYSNTDVIEIYKEGNLKQRVRGPEQVEIEKAIVEEVKGIYTSTTSEKTQFTYLYLQAHGDYIFAAYQGKDSEQILHLHVFDWDGKPVKRLAFDREVSAFWAEETSKNVFQAYVVDGEEGMLNKIELKI